MRKLLQFGWMSVLCALLLVCAAPAHAHDGHDAHAEAPSVEHAAHAHHAAETTRATVAASPGSCPGDGGSACCLVRHWSSGTPQPRVGPASTAFLFVPACPIAYVVRTATSPVLPNKQYLIASGTPRAPPAAL